MTIRFDDEARTLRLSVLDLVEIGADGGHLRLDAPVGSAYRMQVGQQVHADWQEERAGQETFRAEVTVRAQVACGDWTVTVHGRLDGLTTEHDHTVVEEVKSTVLGGDALYKTMIGDWRSYAAQAELYVWLLAQAGYPSPTARLVLVSVLDGARHGLGVPAEIGRVGAWVLQQVDRLCRDRERRIAWLTERTQNTVPWPFPGVRAGQDVLGRELVEALDALVATLVQAPTGWGKTAVVLDAVLKHAFAHKKQVFWATARTTQQRVVIEAAERLRAAGLPLRVTVLGRKERLCLNDRVACRPETCKFAASYWDRYHDADAGWSVGDRGISDVPGLRAAGTEWTLCPHALGVDAALRSDLVIGDYNYAFDPDVKLRRLFGDEASRFVVVVDEAHQLVDRARGWWSPSVTNAAVEAALTHASTLADGDGFVEWVQDVRMRLIEAIGLCEGPWINGEALAEPSARLWIELADRADDLGFEYVARYGVPGDDDAWVTLTRAVRALAMGLADKLEGVVTLACSRPESACLRRLCLDPSAMLGPEFTRLGGLVLSSATLEPASFYRDVLGVPESARVLAGDDPERRPKVVVVPRVSTAFKDRVAQAEPTAKVLSACLAAIPGNAAVYFPSFAMQDDLVPRIDLGGRVPIVQTRAMSEDDRDRALTLLSTGVPSALFAVLGGIFAEGIDLPPGALQGVLICGPGLPPIGLERDLLRAHFEERHGEGFRYASLVPGLTRVVQAAGRLHRRPEDRGVIVLLDRRFRWRDIQALLPSAWDLEVPDEPAAAIRSYFMTTVPP